MNDSSIHAPTSLLARLALLGAHSRLFHGHGGAEIALAFEMADENLVGLDVCAPLGKVSTRIFVRVVKDGESKRTRRGNVNVALKRRRCHFARVILLVILQIKVASSCERLSHA